MIITTNVQKFLKINLLALVNQQAAGYINTSFTDQF